MLNQTMHFYLTGNQRLGINKSPQLSCQSAVDNNTGVCEKTLLRKRLHMGQLNSRAPNQGLESSFCCCLQGKGLRKRIVVFTDAGMRFPTDTDGGSLTIPLIYGQFSLSSIHKQQQIEGLESQNRSLCSLQNAL